MPRAGAGRGFDVRGRGVCGKDVRGRGALALAVLACVAFLAAVVPAPCQDAAAPGRPQGAPTSTPAPAAATQALQVKVVDALSEIYGPDQVMETITLDSNAKLAKGTHPQDLDKLYHRLADLPDLGTVRIVGPRNGRCSGQVVAWGKGAGRIHVEMGPLQSDKGAIPAKAVQIRYLTDSGINTVGDVHDQKHPDNHFFNRWYNLSYYDALQEAAPAEADLLPIWITVSVPADAAPGPYKGTLIVREAVDAHAAEVGERKVPVELTVSAWVHPRPEDFTVHNGHFLQSPETLAMQYKVPIWSPEHIRLIEKSFHYMGLLGNRSVIVTAQHRTHLGNEGAMIVFRQEKPDAPFLPDFRVMNLYLDAYARNVQTPEFVTLYVWEPGVHLSGMRTPPQPSAVLTRIVDGQPQEWAVPIFDPAPDGGTLGILLRGFRDEIRKRGWEKTQILIGMAQDAVPDEATAARFAELAPWAKWVRFSHYAGDPAPAPGDTSFSTPKYLPLGFMEEPTGPCQPRGGWDMAFPRLTILRRQVTEYTPLTQFRNAVDFAVGGTPYQKFNSNAYIGLCRWGMDFWNLDNGKSLLLKYEANRWGLMYRPQSIKKLMAAGPDGPVATTRLEMLLEGLQETEARIALEKALRRESLATDMRAQIEAALKRRFDFRTRNGQESLGSDYQGENREDEIVTRLWGVAPDWQGEALKLFDLAAKAKGD